ncbi:hypothetical protein K450DRAFT_222038 [Umbelopsis ramanniana AG]|uniref:Uncharacterized protein n=1 Tax=Umbelopsis ramanniana AG TaxID=1314678 RepID=A0AAD5EH61_UMBRA|nr:uncharacterized protein K450DRAFT_222038 [Umbelopsis ramanniana AG]KAI8583628.1 hypothetical protein K450DRAFT_222038 [Umbelopsis ramanniana AG]
MDPASRDYDWQDKNTFIAEQQGPSLDGAEDIQQATQIETVNDRDAVNSRSNSDRRDSKSDKQSHTRRSSSDKRRSRRDSRSPERDHHSHRRSKHRRRSSPDDNHHVKLFYRMTPLISHN